ncbi:alanine racemase [Isoptericola sp. NEAU-Y5]|uniref:Alanine racemase n=1 Tax=Isoptericola luteus TaxID=2879484 RepID=A0ABS7ZGP7_9MICO|nr:alanine racemase [Isoptericola sp. NEAU-Y5]MCA5894088.1 alanine racemase [Isoptericola sp. NEAU-Y5]
MDHDARCGIDRTLVAALAEERTGWQHKAVPPALHGLTVTEVRERRPRLAELGTPVLTLSRPALTHNVRVMADWCAARGLDLAPHGKTTMAPQLWTEQIDAGAWAITVANASQLGVARAFGVTRVMVANSLVSPHALRWVADELAAHDDLRVLVWADSTDTVRLMDDVLAAHRDDVGPRPPLDVLVERGGAGGRTGARTGATALDVARAVSASPHLRLAGVAGYEGALAHDSDERSRGVVRAWLRDLVDLHVHITDDGLYDVAVPIVSAGGSAYFDVVAEVLGPLTGPDVRVVLRSGAYQVHDDGFYRHVSPLGDEPRTDGPALRPAMHGWVRVSSRPEAGLALVDGGKRDLPFDEGLPEVQRRRPRTSGEPLATVTGATVTALNDQHGFVRLAPAGSDLGPAAHLGPAPHLGPATSDDPATGTRPDTAAADLRIGDVLRLGLSHPCTAMDKWTMVPVIDDADAADPVVVDLVRTFF